MNYYSHNELRSLLASAFEGVGWSKAQCQDAAHNTVWLEAAGLDGLKWVTNKWDIFSKIPKEPNIVAQINDTAVDVQSDSLVRIGQTICDYVVANAQNTSCAILEVRNCTDRGFIIPSLAYYAGQHMHLIARWYSQDHFYSAMNDPSNPSSVDCVQGLRLHQGKRTTDTLFLACSKSKEHIERFQNSSNAEARNRSLILNLSSREVSRNISNSIEHGIPAKDEWISILQRSANKTLVPNSELSRAGAGD